jgi:hypothetical protein
MADRTALIDGLRREALAPVTDDGIATLVAAIRGRARGPVRAVLFYGSGLWNGAAPDKVQDFYVLVDRLRDYDERILPVALGRVLPPNVYYLAADDGQARYRAKVTVMRWDQFARAAAGRAATPHIWARFAQPCRVVATDTPERAEAVLEMLADAVLSFHRKLRPLMAPSADARGVWVAGLTETYARELRSERPDRAATVFDADPQRLAWRTRIAFAVLGTTPTNAARRHARLAVAVARPCGKLVTLLRLMKATITFDGGVDYVLWKIERHSGVRVTPSTFARRHPLIGGWPLLIRLYRRGAFR